MSKEQFIVANYEHFVARSKNGWHLEVIDNEENHTRDFVWSKDDMCQLAAHVVEKEGRNKNA